MKRKLTLLASVLVIALVGIMAFAYSGHASTNSSECGDCLREATARYRQCQQNDPDNSKCEGHFEGDRYNCRIYYCKGNDREEPVESTKHQQ